MSHSYRYGCRYHNSKVSTPWCWKHKMMLIWNYSGDTHSKCVAITVARFLFLCTLWCYEYKMMLIWNHCGDTFIPVWVSLLLWLDFLTVICDIVYPSWCWHENHVVTCPYQYDTQFPKTSSKESQAKRPWNKTVTYNTCSIQNIWVVTYVWKITCHSGTLWSVKNNITKAGRHTLKLAQTSKMLTQTIWRWPYFHH